jgi:hypothetical protein
MMKKSKIASWLLAGSFLLASAGIAAEVNGDKTTTPLAKSGVRGDIKYLQINNLSIPFENNGIIADASDGIAGPLHGAGGEYPAGSDLQFLFSSGFMMSGLVGGEVWSAGVASASRVQDFDEGSVGQDPGDATAKIYVLNSTDGPGSEAWTDWSNAVALGADYIDVDGNGSYDPTVDRPDLLGDQMLWFTINDSKGPGDRRWAGLPRGIEVQVTAFAFARSGNLGNIAFVRFRIVHKGTETIEETYFSSWHDPDLGDYTDDKVGCDPSLSAGFTYNEGSDGAYGVNPPAFLVDFFQGPIVDSEVATDTAYSVLGPNLGVVAYPGKKVLGLSSFTQYIQSDPTLGDPDTQTEARNYLTGLTQGGEVFDPLVRGTGGSASDDPLFWYSGDPETGTGWLQDASSDQRMLLNTGPFTMVPGDVQDVVTAFVVGRGVDANNSVTVAKEIDAFAQTLYDNNFDVASPPPAVALETRVIPSGSNDGTFSIDLLWNGAEAIADSQVKPPALQIFEGFLVKQLRTGAESDDDRIIASFDMNNSIGDIYVDGKNGRLLAYGADQNLDGSAYIGGEGAYLKVSVTTDAFTGEPFKLGSKYYFGVVGYSVDQNNFKPNLNTGDPDDIAASEDQVLANKLSQAAGNLAVVVPGETENFSISLDNDAERLAGGSDGKVQWDVVDPKAVTGLSYELTFHEDADFQPFWRVTRSDGAVVLDNQYVQSGAYNFPVVDGIMFRVTGAPSEFKLFSMTANNAGPLDPVEAAAPEWQGFPVPGGDSRPTDAQQATNGTAWFIHSIRNTAGGYADFIANTTQYTGGFGAAVTGVAALVPNDYEFRFTGAGKGFNHWDGGAIIDVPFEVWNLRATPDDPSDDYKLVAYILHGDANVDKYSMLNDDHAASGGTDDPYTEGFYLLDPKDKTPGTAGHDAVLAGATEGDTGWALDLPGSIPSLMRLSYVSWNGGDATDSTLVATLEAAGEDMPEQGTVIRIATTKPNLPGVDVFKIDTKGVVDVSSGLVAENFDRANIFPNPYLAYNPLEASFAGGGANQFVTFTHLPQKANIRIFTLSGKLVREIEKNDESPFLRWDLLNAFGLKLASGVYIIHIEAPDLNETKTLKFAMVNREARLQRF